MAFKSKDSTAVAPDNPAILFKTLTQRTLPDVMPHQKEMLEKYAEDYVDQSDVALQLPTGSGKTLVGLLIAEWCRRKFQHRVVYLCPTRQLVNQTVTQATRDYGLDVVGLAGPKREFPASITAAYRTGRRIAVTTYSSLFNINPFFSSPDVIILDDAHAAENYIASMWSLQIKSSDKQQAVLYGALAEFLRDRLVPQDHARLAGEWVDTFDTKWIDKLPSPLVDEVRDQLCAIVDAHAEDHLDIMYRWSLLRDHIDACHVYLGSQEILIRPLIPPTWTLPPFNDAKQRVFMSATLGEGGDLERLTGRPKICRLPAPEGFRTTGVGRRFFIFPSLSLEPQESRAARLAMQIKGGRSVVLTPSTESANSIGKELERISGMRVFDARDIEKTKAEFVAEPRAAAMLPNRYDGIDFPHDECRLLCLHGLPRAMNAQERFLMSKMGATALFNERIQTRVLQAAGRCTRALQDRSAVVVTGGELVDYLSDDRNWLHFHPELQAELAFGVEQSQEVSQDTMLDNLQIFLDNKRPWATANEQILADADTRVRSPYPAMDTLARVVRCEIRYQEALWNKDYALALTCARQVHSRLVDSELRGYRAWWYYLAGSAARRLSENSADGHAQTAREQYACAKRAAPGVTWLSHFTQSTGEAEADSSDDSNTETSLQVERIETRFLAIGTSSERKFEKIAAKILEDISTSSRFEEGQRLLGELLGFQSANSEADAAPDPWWFGGNIGIVYEDHADGGTNTVLGANKARQVASHPKWILENIAGAHKLKWVPVLVSPCTRVMPGAVPHLDGVLLWPLNEFRQWASRAVATLRELKGEMPPREDLEWRAKAGSTLESNNLTLLSILEMLAPCVSQLDIIE